MYSITYSSQLLSKVEALCQEGILGCEASVRCKAACFKQPEEELLIQTECDKMWDEPSQVSDRGAGGTTLTIGRVKGEGVVDCSVK